MKIVTASKFYYQRAGLESYLFKITDILRSKGHEIIPFSTNYKKNEKTAYDNFFAEYIELGGEEKISLLQKFKALIRIFYNKESRNKFSDLLNQTKPDIIWGFGVHRHLSPSILIEAKKRNIPIVHRLSDYAIICPDSRLTKGNGELCSGVECACNGYHNAIINRCVRLTKSSDGKKASLPASIIGATELYFHNKYKFYTNNVTKFIAPSNFLKNIMIKSGISPEQIEHIPIFIDAKKYTPEYSSEATLVYFGRLNWEKGLPVLLEAMSEIKHFKLIIVGEGPERKNLEEIKQRKNLMNVKFTGKLYGDELHKIVKKARLVVIPSVWFDNSPNVILEAFALGKPVLGADIGGIPEYIDPSINGMLYEYNNIEELREKIVFLMNQPSLCKEMGIAARKIVEEIYNPEVHYSKVFNLLQKLVQNKNNLNQNISTTKKSKNISSISR